MAPIVPSGRQFCIGPTEAGLMPSKTAGDMGAAIVRVKGTPRAANSHNDRANTGMQFLRNKDIQCFEPPLRIGAFITASAPTHLVLRCPLKKDIATVIRLHAKTVAFDLYSRLSSGTAWRNPNESGSLPVTVPAGV